MTAITRIEERKQLMDHFQFINDRIKVNYGGHDAKEATKRMRNDIELMDNFLDIIFKHEV